MKLVSYYQVNAFLRRQRFHQKSENSKNDGNTIKVDKNNNNEKKVEVNVKEEDSSDEVVVTYPNNLNYQGRNNFLFSKQLLELSF